MTPYTRCRLYQMWIVYWFVAGQYLIGIAVISPSSSSTSIRAVVHPGIISIEWTSGDNITNSASSDEYSVAYHVLGSSSHSVTKLQGDVTRTNISTSSYPGMVYQIILYRNTMLLGTRFVRSACGSTQLINNGMTVYMTSPNYPEYIKPGTVCTWTYRGEVDTWFAVTLNDVRVPQDSCHTYIDISGQQRMCNTSMIKDVFYVTRNEVVVTSMSRSAGGRFNFTMEAIPPIDTPDIINVTSRGDAFRVSWTGPNNTAPDMYYVIKYNILPTANESERIVAGNVTQYDLEVKGHRGQLFNISLAVRGSYWESNWSDNVIMRSDCTEEYYLEEHTSITILSPDYPRDIGSDAICNWYINTSRDWYVKIALIDPDGADLGETITMSIQNHTQRQTLEVDTPLVQRHTLEGNTPLVHRHTLEGNTPLVMPDSHCTVTLQTGNGGHVYPALRIRVSSVAPPTLPPRSINVDVSGTVLYIHWEAPASRPDDVIEYVIMYDVIPDVRSDVEIHVNSSFTHYGLSTRGYEGRVFTVVMVAITDGGRSDQSPPVYVRSHCGGKRTLQHQESMLIISPRGSEGFYPPGVVCKWQLSTTEYLWLKVGIDIFHLENSSGCESDYVDFDGNRKCGSNILPSLLFQKSQLEIVFVSDGYIQEAGFILSVRAVAQTPNMPALLRVRPSMYGLVVTWAVPDRNPHYVTGYRLHYCHSNKNNSLEVMTLGYNTGNRTSECNSVSFTKDTKTYFINTQQRPGVMYEVWMESRGEALDSRSTGVVLARAECGGAVEFANTTQYISSTNYPNVDEDHVHCVYHVTGNGAMMTLTFIDLACLHSDGDNDNASCNYGYVSVDGVSTSCEQEKEIKYVLHGVNFTIEYQSFPGCSKFLLQISRYKVKHEERNRDLLSPVNRGACMDMWTVYLHFIALIVLGTL